MRKTIPILFCLICFVCCEISFSQFEQNKLDSALSLALKCMKLTKEDLSLRNDYVEVDVFRQPIINSLMKEPLSTFFLVEYSFQEYLNLIGLENSVSFAGRLLDARLPITDLGIDIGWEMLYGKRATDYIKEKKNFSPILNETLSELYNWMVISDSVIKFAVTKQDLINQKSKQSYLSTYFTRVDSIKQKVLPIILEDVNDEFKSAEQLDYDQKLEEELSKQLIPLVVTLDYKNFIGQISYTTRSIEKLLLVLADSNAIKLPKKSKKNDIIWSQKTPMGEFIIGGKGSSHYTGSPALIIDLGGDDIYELSYDSTVCTQVIIDLGGNDTYKALTDFCLASGFFGTGILIDEEGDDTYLGRNFCLGSGLFGVGILLDKKGNDKYFGDTFTQGAGAWGIGILADLEGADNYNGALYSQGFGGVAGFGSLIDKAGNDNYFAGGKYKDILRYKEHYLSLSQGFSYGIRPYMSGGVGLLLDYAGNDGYVSDIFGQGASYWWGWGCLYDKEGNDFYQAFQYAQGSATHMTLGTLIDGAGDDIYSSKGVSQGCGHDWACGILLDNSGNDNFYANDLSQGAGNANGVGIFIDQAGDDGFYVKSKANTQGYGNPRREYGSIGIFLDMFGKDKYDGNGCDGCWWSIDSKWGVGLDLEMK